jgi:hypothetical protein
MTQLQLAYGNARFGRPRDISAAGLFSAGHASVAGPSPAMTSSGLLSQTSAQRCEREIRVCEKPYFLTEAQSHGLLFRKDAGGLTPP